PPPRRRGGLGRSGGAWRRSFDHFLRKGIELQRDFEPERLGSLEIEHELEFGHLHDRKVSGLLALENAARISARLTISFTKIRSIAHETALHDRLALGIGGRNPIARCKPDKQWNLRPPEIRITRDQERTGAPLDQCCIGGFDLSRAAGAQNQDLSSKLAR